MKFGIGPDWVPLKYDVSVPMPDVLDLEALRGFGLQPGEEELPEAVPEAPAGTEGAAGGETTHSLGWIEDKKIIFFFSCIFFVPRRLSWEHGKKRIRSVYMHYK